MEFSSTERTQRAMHLTDHASDFLLCEFQMIFSPCEQFSLLYMVASEEIE